MERRQRKVAAASGGSSTVSKGFVCSFSGCEKRFTRAEHLQRHSLNHTPGSATCPRCRAHFKRPDLLERHLNRHRQRDEEAGGAGHGVLNTRKRLWKAPDGSVVQNRPLVDVSEDCRSPKPPSDQGRSESEESGPHGNIHVNHPISPPTSEDHSDLAPHQDFQDDQYASSYMPLDGSSWSFTGAESLDPTLNINPDDSFFLDPGLFPPPASASSSQQSSQLYDDFFQPDTASSFNMPYTTAANYNWLFDQSSLIGVITESQAISSTAGAGFGLHSGLAEPMDTQVSPQSAAAITSAQGPEDNVSHEPVPITPSVTPQQRRHSSRPCVHLNPAPAGDITSTQPDEPVAFCLPVQVPAGYDLERPLSTLKSVPRFPTISDEVRGHILEAVEAVQPVLPTGQLRAWEDPLLSLSCLQDYLDLFFTRFNTAYPLIHSATFEPSRTEPLLVLAILLLGATYSSREAHQLAVCIHDVIRPQIFAHAGFSPKPELWVLQTILLVECFGKSRAGQKQHDMSHLFHGLLINLIRRSDCQSIQSASISDGNSDKNDLGNAWRQWAKSEEKKRLAFLCFMWDTQHAVLFCQSLCMSAFELRLSMPCGQALWEAEDESDWERRMTSEKQPELSFLAALKTYLIEPNNARPRNFNALSRILLLHGLMSISWDMERRDQTALGAASFVDGVNWRHRLGDAYDLWKTDFDAYCSEIVIKQRRMQQQGSTESEIDWSTRRQQFSTFATAYLAVYHASQIHLNSSFLDVQIYAGARHILGRPVYRNDYVRSERTVKRWASGNDMVEPDSRDGSSGVSARTPMSATKAAFHAASALHEASNNLDDFDSMGLFHVPWCLYLSTLTLWAFHHARPATPASIESEDSEMVWDARKEMQELLVNMVHVKSYTSYTSLARQTTGGLVWVMADVLSKVRWGIIHSGVLVLRALIPMRLISQYEVS
ncbi:hypothetical protein JX265_009988 [Neoarthrinium moseri]|uniref:C2H2-type domain-containing protein n=1 Tax=Neoarthrinium moseri TaxID=1658444 RepID=A0A9P9WF34_9PEZI|nr:hypothetical protein JX265_009988 [Neoarthrinium moseri]